jgi:hypothetical protein
MHKLTLAVAVLAASLFVVASATAEGPTPAQLEAQGWTCFVPPTNVGIRCAPPGLGRPPLPPEPNGRPSYVILAFDFGGNFLGTQHLIRADLYRGQLCPPSGGPYAFRAAIGYYECSHF